MKLTLGSPKQLACFEGYEYGLHPASMRPAVQRLLVIAPRMFPILLDEFEDSTLGWSIARLAGTLQDHLGALGYTPWPAFPPVGVGDAAYLMPKRRDT